MPSAEHCPGISYHRQTYFLTSHSHAQSVNLLAFIPKVANTSNHDTSPVITSYIVYFFVVVQFICLYEYIEGRGCQIPWNGAIGGCE